MAGGAAILGALGWQFGAGPFLDGLRLVSPVAVLSAVILGGVSTVACAWRWTAVARGLGMDVPLRAAVAAYYRSLLLNVSLPGGVAGDIHRAVVHGRQVGDLHRAARAVVWERGAGQATQVALTVLVLALLPSPARLPMGVAVVVALAVLAGLVLTLRAMPARWWVGRAAGAVLADLRRSVLRRRTLLVVVPASVVAVACHAAVFVMAARAAGVTLPAGALAPVLLVVLLAAALPVNVGGWGPREGMAAWAFAGAGLGAAQGLTVSVVYGVLVLVASLPGAWVLMAGRRPVRPGGGRAVRVPMAGLEGAAHG